MDDFLRSTLPADAIPAVMKHLPELNVTQPDKVNSSNTICETTYWLSLAVSWNKSPDQCMPIIIKCPFEIHRKGLQLGHQQRIQDFTYTV